MKKLFILLTIFFAGTFCQAQILKDLSRRITNDAESKVEQKVSSKMDQGVDSLTKKRVKSKSKSKDNNASSTVNPADSTVKNVQTSQGNNNVSTQTAPTTASTTSENSSKPVVRPDPYSGDGSFISLKVFPAKVLLKNSVSISGASVKYQNLNKVVMSITAENKVSQSKDIPLKDDGTFSTTWQPGGDGDYTITVKSSDGKGVQSETVSVYDYEEMDSVTEEPKKETQKAFDNLKKDVDAILPMLSSKDASDLQNKMTTVTQRKDAYMNFLNSMDDAGKQFDALEKQQGLLPTEVVSNFSKVTDQVLQTSDNMKQANEAANHQPYDNSICEYLVMVKEACAAFGTITGFYTKSMFGLLKNITTGNGLPGSAGTIGEKAGLGTDANNIGKQCTKIASVAAVDAESLASNLLSAGSLGFAGDMASFCADHLLDQYCTSMSGDLSEKYECTLRNKGNIVWWNYKYTTSAMISLRCPKTKISNGILKMKGNIEGNATNFSIYQNVNEIDDYKEQMKNRDRLVPIYSICLHQPISVGLNTTKADQNLGFGAVARAIVTPAYFNIPIDADYDVGNKKLTIYVNSALVDFGPQVSYVYEYIAIAAGIPLFTRVNYPINSVKLTLGKVISDHKTFNVAGDEKVSVKGKGQTHLGDENTFIEQRIDLEFLLKGQ